MRSSAVRIDGAGYARWLGRVAVVHTGGSLLCPFELSRAERKAGEVFDPVYTRIWLAEVLRFRVPKSLSVRTVLAARSLWAVYVRCDL